MTERIRRSGISRRGYLRRAASTTALGTAGLAGCIGNFGGGGGLDELRLAYMPIYPDMQYFVMQEEGYFDDLDVSVTAKQFPDGASIVQAYASGKIDVAMFGVVPALIVIDKGIAAQIVAANIKNAMGIYAHDDLLALWEKHGKMAFKKFEEEKGRKFKFGTFPPGTVPDILLRYWMIETLGLNVDEHVDVVPMGFGKVRQNMAAGNIDGTSIMEPMPTLMGERDMPYGPVALAEEFLPGQPAATVLMSDEVRNDHPDLARDFLRKHIRATEFANNNPDEAAVDYSTIVGKEVVPPEIAKAAMDSPLANFISNPREIVPGTKIYAEYTKRLDKTEKQLTTKEIFDFSIYEDVSG